ncbi:GTPase of the mitochondrial inner membrane that associates with the large ribosomal subunit [Sporothrix stenoceras]|uniref:GTPase of the mitochondrial inner membrane that associates with the large ribosomal subunit n=1 Tax=Sporothrix stenoceras TaxID=5173 RepID=A0ABR3YY62_9PEZI
MASRCSGSAPLFLSFLYPSVQIARYAGHSGRRAAITAVAFPATRPLTCRQTQCPPRRHYTSKTTPPPSTEDTAETEELEEAPEEEPSLKYPVSRLNPAPDDYASMSFADKATLTVHAGSGGAGCISFLRDMFIPDGPANGGDGGHGGNVYIQAVPGETSLHKIARRRVMRAGRGKHGQGSARNGTRGDDLIVTVPVGTVITEVSRVDPVAEDAAIAKERHYARKRKRYLAHMANEAAIAAAKMAKVEAELALGIQEEVEDVEEGEKREEGEEVEVEVEEMELIKSPEQLRLEQDQRQRQEELEEDEAAEADFIRRKWVVYPGLAASEVRNIDYPRLPRRDRFFVQPPAPIYLDLSRPTTQPILLAAGGIGGLGNPHFVSRRLPRPMVATRGENAVSLTVNMELKLLADVGLVGLPNAGKSTLLRAVSNSRARVGSWAFTTLQPNIGTVVLDNNHGRPVVSMRPQKKKVVDTENDPFNVMAGEEAEEVMIPPRTRFTIADIPGLIEGAHLDKGLGIEFLRHVERAGVLAFVVDLGAGNAVAALKALWREVGLYARLRAEEEEQREREARIEWESQDHASSQTMSYTAADAQRADASAPTVSPELAIAGKPWFVVATKGDLPSSEANFGKLKEYIDRVGRGEEEHPSGVKGGWTKNVAAIPVSAINGHGVDSIIHWTVGLLDL